MAIYGDTSDVFRDHQHGGNQQITLPDDVGGAAYGDASQFFDKSQGGDDALSGGARADNTLFGDADTMHDRSHGGNDTLIGAGLRDHLFGDAYAMYDHASGGNDTLVMGASFELLFGDAYEMRNHATGGHDDINDFRQSDGDRIDVSAWGFLPPRGHDLHQRWRQHHDHLRRWLQRQAGGDRRFSHSSSVGFPFCLTA
ncbi:MAG: hypothetical protein ISP45_03880 [Reyranella sp.]|nr:hypothetical protein [Reyranella sp.]